MRRTSCCRSACAHCLDSLHLLGGRRELDQYPEQLVILGAGFDARAYRLPGLRGITVFEVDHPDTPATKRQVLERALSMPPKHVRFVALDFNQRDLASVMAAAGYRESARTFLLWGR